MEHELVQYSLGSTCSPVHKTMSYATLKGKEDFIMKKLFIGALIAMSAISFVACGNTAQDNNSANTNGAVTTEVAQEEEKEEEDTANTLYDADDIKITTEGFVDEDIWGMGIQLAIENNSDRHLCVSIEDASLDGYMVTMLGCLDVTSGMKDKEVITFCDDDSAEYKDFQGTLHIYDGDSYDTIMDIPFTYSVQ